MKLRTPEIFKEKKFINEGAFGKVYRAKIGDNLYALKKIKVEATADYGFPITSIREIKVLKKLERHPNIVQLVEIVRSKSQAVYLVFEFVEFDLYRIIRRDKTVFSKLQLKYMMRQIMEGLVFMHRNRIIHRDIKSENILVSPEGVLKFADFGLARDFARSHFDERTGKMIPGRYTKRVVTPYYRPPEVCL